MASPFLKIGITLAIFSSSGKISDRKDSFIKVADLLKWADLEFLIV